MEDYHKTILTRRKLRPGEINWLAHGSSGVESSAEAGPAGDFSQSLLPHVSSALM